MTEQTKENPATGQDSEANLITNNYDLSTKLQLSRTFEGGVSNTAVKHFDVSLAELNAMLKSENVDIGKKDGPYFIRGRCEGSRNDKGLISAPNLLIIIDGDSRIDEHGEIIDGAPDPKEAHEAMERAGIEHLIYTSYSHHKHGPNYHKWRLLIPSNATAKTLVRAVDGILDILHLEGVLVAPAKENYSLSQPWFFPRLESSRASGYFTDLYETGSPYNAPESNLEGPPATIVITTRGQGKSVIEAYCDAYPLASKIECMGFKHVRENRYLPPESKSGIAGAIILKGEQDGHERLYVHNSSHHLHGRACDSFDLYCELEHNGDFKAAVKAAAELLGLEATNEAFAQFIEAEDDNEDTKQDPLPVDIRAIALEKPPGLAGEICDFLSATANRPIPLIYPLVALQMLSLVAGKRKGLDGTKLNLLTLAIAPSAAGKEHGQSWLAKTAAELKLGRHVVGGISSDVDMIKNLIEGDARCCYRIDEIQGLFNSINSKNANTYESKIGDLILTLATSKIYMFAGNHRRQFFESIDKDIEYHKKKILKAENAGDDTDNLNRALVWLSKKRDFIENGWPDPIVSIMGHSTPSGLDSLVTEENISSGLIGRCIVIRCSDSRQKLQKTKKNSFYDDVAIINRLDQINNSNMSLMKVSFEAEAMLDYISNYYDQDERLNAPVMGAIYARVMEQVNKIASLLAMEGGVIEEEHVAYAFALITRCVEDISFLVRKDIAQKADATIEEIAIHTREQIKRQIGVDGTPPSTLKQKVLKCNKKLKQLTEQHKKSNTDKGKPDLYDQVIDRMAAVGDLELKQKGRSKRYYLIKGSK